MTDSITSHARSTAAPSCAVLMKAVSKYDPNQGARLGYYSSWWIRSYILKYLLDNFRLVKIGTTVVVVIVGIVIIDIVVVIVTHQLPHKLL